MTFCDQNTCRRSYCAQVHRHLRYRHAEFVEHIQAGLDDVLPQTEEELALALEEENRFEMEDLANSLRHAAEVSINCTCCVASSVAGIFLKPPHLLCFCVLSCI